MTDDTPHQDPDRIDSLLKAAARGDPATTDSLAELLAAAATPDRERALAGEERMLAEYQAAAPPTAGPARNHRVLRATVAATLAALSLCGIAAAAQHPQPPASPVRPQPPSVSGGATPTPHRSPQRTTPPAPGNGVTTEPGQRPPSTAEFPPTTVRATGAQRSPRHSTGWAKHAVGGPANGPHPNGP
ncbi:hypothetical protein [Gandjariella thermophila]|uniref:Uncharacterized protein n=1 Tax=Gandjariella thermophila TaxID=1931992 RepID=A0A4D4JCA3_9PSEU|nr:hypothetical protein [Gandjariella thermophila]GDY32288.1 hypothetical protein GTS_39210 [Gandjariella thermophila]